MFRAMTVLLVCTVALGGCGRMGGWFGGGPRAPETLDPRGGYPASTDDGRPLMPGIASARMEQIPEGRLLVVTASVPTKGFWDVALLTETPQPEGRYRPDPDGVLRLRLVGMPPLPGSPEAQTRADQRVDSITVALSLSYAALAGVDRVQVTSATNTVTLGR